MQESTGSQCSSNIAAVTVTPSREGKPYTSLKAALTCYSGSMVMSGEQSIAIVKPHCHQCTDEVGGDTTNQPRMSVGHLLLPAQLPEWSVDLRGLMLSTDSFRCLLKTWLFSKY